MIKKNYNFHKDEFAMPRGGGGFICVKCITHTAFHHLLQSIFRTCFNFINFCLLVVAAGHVLVTWYDRVTSPNAMSAATSCPSAALATIELTTSTQQQQQQQLQKKSKKTSLEPQTPSTPTTTGAPGTTTTQKASVFH